jgi:6-methylsalicylate decarboxylase
MNRPPNRRRSAGRCFCCDPAAIGRRGFLAGAAALAATGAAEAQMDDKPHRIDVHHHIVPPT